MSQPEIKPDRPFGAPWQAQAFAMTVALHENGLFAWSEWTAALSDALARDDTSNAGSYYRCWLVALERLVDRKLGATGSERQDLAQAWARAAEATPHGRPILLENDLGVGPAQS